MKFGHKHYVPILKTKAGERWAIDHTAPARRQNITPLWEVHKHKEKGSDEHAAEMCENIASVWGTNSAMYLDTCWLHPATGDPTTVASVFASARAESLQAIPVVRLPYDSATLDVFADIVAEDDRGWLLRLSQEEFGNAARIDQVVAHLGKPRGSVDLLMDYKNVPMHLQMHVPTIPHLADWRTLTASSGTFPRSLAGRALHTWHAIDRSDWTSWQMGVSAGLPRLPAFGDYTIRDHGPAAEGGEPSANLRYACDVRWIAMIGGKFKLGHAADMHGICSSLVARPEYAGSTFCDGDAIIHQTANPAASTGAPQQWIQWGMNHHIAFTVEQLLAMP